MIRLIALILASATLLNELLTRAGPGNNPRRRSSRKLEVAPVSHFCSSHVAEP